MDSNRLARIEFGLLCTLDLYLPEDDRYILVQSERLVKARLQRGARRAARIVAFSEHLVLKRALRSEGALRCAGARHQPKP